jgi:lipid-binding SYLF domain-containing protein
MKKFKMILVGALLLLGYTQLQAKTAQEINQEADQAIANFRHQGKSAAEYYLTHAKGLLVFPEVYKAGIGIGGEYGEGVLRVDGVNMQYYSTASASIGLQLGAQTKSILIVFLTDKALQDFRMSDGWEVGVDGSVALVKIGTGKDITSGTYNEPVVGFIFGNKGLMYNLTLEGSKFSKISR